MARGHPDYGNPGYQTSAIKQDFGEMLPIVRGSGSIDNQGKLIFVDLFTDGLYAWSLSAGAGAAAPYLTTQRAETSPSSVFMDAGNANPSSSTEISHACYPGRSYRIGFEVSIMLYSTAAQIFIYTSYANEIYYATGTIWIDTPNAKIYIQTPDGYIEIADLILYGSTEVWTPFKLVVDIENHKYIRLLYGAQVLDLSDYDLVYDTDPYASPLVTGIIAKQAVANHRYLYVDRAYITIDEP